MGMVEDIKVRLGLDSSGFSSGVENAVGSLKRIQSGMGAIGLGALGPLVLIGAMVKSFAELVLYAERLTGNLDANQQSARGFAQAIHGLWDGIRQSGKDSTVQILGYINSLGEWWGRQIAIRSEGEKQVAIMEEIARQSEINIERLKQIQPINEKIGELVKQRAADEQKLIGVAEQKLNAERLVYQLQQQYDAAEGDIVAKKTLQLQLEQAKTDLSKISTAEALAQKQAADQVAAAEKQIREQKLQTLTHQERLNYYQNEILAQQAKASSLLSSEAEKGAAIVEIKKLQAAAEKENADWRAKAALEAKDQVEYAILLHKSAQGLTLEERTRLEILNLIIKQKENERRVNEILADGRITDQEAAELAAIQKQNDALAKQIQLKQGVIDSIKVQLQAEQAVTAELQQQVKEQNSLAGFSGDMGVGYALGGFSTYNDPTEQARYEAQLRESTKKDLQAEIDMWQKKIDEYRTSGSTLGKYESQALEDRIKALQSRLSHLDSYIFDPNYSDKLGQGIFAQQVTQIGDPLGLQGSKTGGTLDDINQGIQDLNTRFRLAGFGKT